MRAANGVLVAATVVILEGLVRPPAVRGSALTAEPPVATLVQPQIGWDANGATSVARGASRRCAQTVQGNFTVLPEDPGSEDRLHGRPGI